MSRLSRYFQKQKTVFMMKRNKIIADGSIAIVVGAPAEEFDRIKRYLSDWQCVAAPLNNEGAAVSSIPATPELIIIYARNNEKDTLAICEQLRNSTESSAIPILLAINRYEITQGSAVKRMGNTSFIIIPFNEKELCNKINELFESS